QTVRPQVRCVRDVLEQLVDRAADLSGVHPAAPPAEEKRRTTAGPHHLTSPELQPSAQRRARRSAERNRPFLGSLAHYTDQVGAEVEVVDVQTHQLAHPD